MERKGDRSGRLEKRYLYAIFCKGDFDSRSKLVSVSYSLRKAKEVVENAIWKSDMKPEFDRDDIIYVSKIRPDQIIDSERDHKLERSALFKKKYNPDNTYCADVFCG